MNRPFPPRKNTGLRVLTYHGFGSENAPTVVDPSLFAETLAAFADKGFQCVDLKDWVTRGCPDEPTGYALAFDDGLGSILRVVDTMARFRVTATVFVVTDRVGKDNAWPSQPAWVPRERLLDWSELAELSSRGFRLGAHGASHAPFGRLSQERIAFELKSVQAIIEDRSGDPCPLLSYPYGNSSPAARRIAATYYASAFGTRLDLASGQRDRFDLARLDTHYFRSSAAREVLVTERVHAHVRWRRSLRTLRSWGGGVSRFSVADRGIRT